MSTSVLKPLFNFEKDIFIYKKIKDKALLMHTQLDKGIIPLFYLIR